MAEIETDARPAREQPPDAAALHFALSSAAGSEAAREYLRNQSEVAAQQARLVGLQADELREEMRLNLSHLRHRRFGDYTKVAFEISIGLVILLVICGIATMVWSATQDRDLVVESFTVPPDVAASGMTGTVLANRILDSLGRLEADPRAMLEGALSYRGDRADEVRVEIPDTGVSLGELNRYLRAWLGHEVHAGGDLVRSAKGLALTVRYGEQPGITLEGGAGDIGRLINQASEHVFAAAQPSRYVEYLVHSRRYADAAAILPSIVNHGTDEERARGYAGWAEYEFWQGHMYAALEKGREAVRLDQANPIMSAWVGAAESNVGHEELAREYLSRTISLWRGSAAVADLASPVFAIQGLDVITAYRDEEVGDYRDAHDHWEQVIWKRDLKADIGNAAVDAAADHDQAAARRYALLVPAKRGSGEPNGDAAAGQFLIAWFLSDWPEALRLGRKADAVYAKQPDQKFAQMTGVWPELAYAMARARDIPGAEKLIAKTGRDCDICMRERGRIAALAGRTREAAQIFATVAARSPHEPFAETYWGEMLLHKGDYGGAIAKFREANLKGPHFADPLEMWGEALMQKNRSDLALAKFAEANKYAPAWGRLHLEWGKALMWSGDKAGAQKQFETAAHLELSKADKSAVSHWQGKGNERGNRAI